MSFLGLIAFSGEALANQELNCISNGVRNQSCEDFRERSANSDFKSFEEYLRAMRAGLIYLQDAYYDLAPLNSFHPRAKRKLGYCQQDFGRFHNDFYRVFRILKNAHVNADSDQQAVKEQLLDQLRRSASESNGVVVNVCQASSDGNENQRLTDGEIETLGKNYERMQRSRMALLEKLYESSGKNPEFAVKDLVWF